MFEAIYRPVPQPNSPNYTPPDVRVIVKALGKYEAQVQAHAAAHQQIACEQTIKPGCSYNPVVAHFPPFAPNESLVEDTGPYGCERIEQYGLDSGPTAGNQGSETLPLLFQFELNVSAPDASMASVAQAAAQRLQSDASIECLAVVGQAAAGETPGIGDLRAENVKRLLVQYGAPVGRLMTVASAVPLFSAGSERPQPKVEDRRVLLKIVLRKGQ